MYSDHLHLHLLTALLLSYRITDVVACPGSRNAAIIHDLHTAGLRLHPVTDERSATFVGIGLWLKVRRPVVICVTSGSALLNTLPGVAEAAMRHIPLVIISADRPPQWIGQLDGQTLPQQKALHPYARTWQITAPHNEEERWWMERLIHESLLATAYEGGSVVHLNVPLAEPLFRFTIPQLPQLPRHEQLTIESEPTAISSLYLLLLNAQCPLLVVGERDQPEALYPTSNQRNRIVVYAECLSGGFLPDAAVRQAVECGEYVPDLILHIGGAMVDKRLKPVLRQLPDLKVVRIGTETTPPDTFLHLTHHLRLSDSNFLEWLDEIDLAPKPAVTAFYNTHPQPRGWRLPNVEAVFLGNSSAVRWGNRFFNGYQGAIYANRGTNGIEGSLSAAAGYSLLSHGIVLCVLGDLSFFYDVNALWNTRLNHRLRILLLNNNGGDIFRHIDGLLDSPAFTDYIQASHGTRAEGIARSYRCHYLSTRTDDFHTSASQLINQLLTVESDRPVILEVLTQQSLL